MSLSPEAGAWAFENVMSTTAAIARRAVGALLSQAGGVIGSGDFAVSPGGLMTVGVAAGQCFAPGSQVPNQGLYYGLLASAGTTPTFISAPSSGQSRIDVVCVTFKDSEYGSYSNGGGAGLQSGQVPSADSWGIGVVTGTAAATGSQVAPALPSNAIALAHVLIAHGTTTINSGMITDVRTYVTAAGSALSGEIKMYGGISVPSGYLACDGSAVSRATYSNLFAALGTQWGVGDGSTTFNLPDMRGRSPLGAGSGGGLTPRTVADSGGEETHTLVVGEQAPGTYSAGGSGTTSGESANHDHSQTGGGTNGFAARYGPGTDWTVSSAAGNRSTAMTFAGTTDGISADHNHTFSVGVSVSDNFGGGAHNTLHPFAVVEYIIKV